MTLICYRCKREITFSEISRDLSERENDGNPDSSQRKLVCIYCEVGVSTNSEELI